MNLKTELLLAGEVISDQPETLDTGVTALSDLSVQWGRSSVLDQPGSTTAQFQVALAPKHAAALMDQITPGLPVLIRTTLDQQIEDQGVITATSNLHASGASLKRSPNTIDLIATKPGSIPITAITPPAPYDPTGKGIAIWDQIPRIGRSGIWNVYLKLYFPRNTRADLFPVYFSGPWEDSASIGATFASITSAGAGPHYFRGSFTPPPSRMGEWVGIGIRIPPFGPTWQEFTDSWETHSETWESYATITLESQELTSAESGLMIATLFDGRISDVSGQWDETLDRPVLSITATDISTELANIRIGDEPWKEEPAASRAARILAATGRDVGLFIDDLPGALTLAPEDVDSQESLGLLENIADSTGSILWTASHSSIGAYIHFEDPNLRKALYKLIIPEEGPARIETGSFGALHLPANLLGRQKAKIGRDTGDLASVVSVRWAEITYSDDGEEVRSEHDLTLTDNERLEKYGYRSIQISTDLVRETDAHQLAVRTMARSAPTGWTIPEVLWDTAIPGSKPTDIIAMLDSTRRIGMPLVLTGLAPWIPGAPALPSYLDGGDYTLNAGVWELNLTITKAAYPGASLPWDQAPEPLTWDRLTTLDWNDISTVTI